jgi:hypothetical protein
VSDISLELKLIVTPDEVIDEELILEITGEAISTIANEHEAVVPPFEPRQFHKLSLEVSITSWNVPEKH